MAHTTLDILDTWERATKIRQEFYNEKAKVDILLQEALALCNNVILLRTKKKSVVRTYKRQRPKL